MPSKELSAALAAARAAAEVIGAHYRKNPSVRTKADGSPVTEADVRAEEVIRATLDRHFPGYGFYGEETGPHSIEAENLWLVDPIDGTKSFVREAGGTFTDLEGAAVDLGTRSVLASNGVLHERVLEALTR